MPVSFYLFFTEIKDEKKIPKRRARSAQCYVYCGYLLKKSLLKKKERELEEEGFIMSDRISAVLETLGSMSKEELIKIGKGVNKAH